MRAPKIVGLDPLPDPVGHFGTGWWSFWIFEIHIDGIIESKTLFAKFDWGSNNLGLNLCQDPVRHFWAPWWPFWTLLVVGCSRWCCVAGSERVPPPPLGWYLNIRFD